MKKYELTQYELVKVRVDHKPIRIMFNWLGVLLITPRHPTRFMDFLRPGLIAGSPFATYDWSFRDPVFFATFRP